MAVYSFLWGMPRSWPPEPGPPGGAERAARVYHELACALRKRSDVLTRASCILPPYSVASRRPSGVPSSTILLLETNPDAATAVERPLVGIGYQVTTTADPNDAVRRAGEFALVIVDVGSGPRSGEDVCREIRGTAAL